MRNSSLSSLPLCLQDIQYVRPVRPYDFYNLSVQFIRIYLSDFITVSGWLGLVQTSVSDLVILECWNLEL